MIKQYKWGLTTYCPTFVFDKKNEITTGNLYNIMNSKSQSEKMEAPQYIVHWNRVFSKFGWMMQNLGKFPYYNMIFLKNGIF